MARRPTEGPTDAELEILNILWQREQATVRDVFEALNRVRPTGYTTALKMLQIMLEKGLVNRDDQSRTHVYTAAIPRSDVQQMQLTTMMDRLFDGSCARLVLHAIQNDRVSRSEIEAIQRILREHGKDKS
jgi:predicted transcriptional regulator